MSDLASIETCVLLDELACRLAPRLVEPMARRVVELLRERDPADPVDPWLDGSEAADYLGVSRDRLRKFAAAGAIPSEQDGPGCKRYFRRSALDRWRESGGQPAHLRRAA
jgi:excisionase family DNA binding protein